jgi:hypothetical protein
MANRCVLATISRTCPIRLGLIPTSADIGSGPMARLGYWPFSCKVAAISRRAIRHLHASHGNSLLSVRGWDRDLQIPEQGSSHESRYTQKGLRLGSLTDGAWARARWADRLGTQARCTDHKFRARAPGRRLRVGLRVACAGCGSTVTD